MLHDEALAWLTTKKVMFYAVARAAVRAYLFEFMLYFYRVFIHTTI